MAQANAGNGGAKIGSSGTASTLASAILLLSSLLTRATAALSQRAIIGLVLAAIALGSTSTPAAAAIAFALNTGNPTTNSQKLLIDSNSCTAAGPHAAFVGGTVTNTGSAPVSNITASMTGFNSNIYLTGGQMVTQSLGTLGAGESVGVYWFVGYSCANLASATPTITFSSSLGTQTSAVNLQIRRALSANAGGLVNSTLLGPGAVVGQFITLQANYSFGGVSQNDEFFLQPAGNQTFDASCFRLVSSQITASTTTAIPVGTRNKLYFVAAASQNGNGQTVTVTYTFQYLCANKSTTADVYAAQTSGNTNIKYTGNFGSTATQITYPGATNPFTITKTVSPTTSVHGVASGPLTYTVTIANPSAFNTIIDRIVDQLPTGMTFIGLAATSDVTAANSGALPAAGATGTLTFVGKLGVSYVLPANGTLKLVYTVSAPTAAGSYTNTAQGFIGLASTPTATSTYTVVPPINGVTESGSVPTGVISTAIANVRSNDTINGSTATASNSTITQFGTWPAGITLNTSTGAVTVAASVPKDTYSIQYSLCDLSSPTPGCVTVTDTINVSSPIVDLKIEKTNNSNTVKNGQTTTYVLTVTNLGPDTATGAIVTDAVGSGLACTSTDTVAISGVGAPSGTFTIADLTGAGITLGTLALNQTTTLTYSCQVN